MIDPIKDKKFLLEELTKEKVLGIDTEFDWRNTYYPILSLLQISAKSKIFLVDCLNLKEFDELREVLKNVNLLIFHSVRSDATVLSSSLGIKVENVFDVQIAERLISKKDNLKYSAIVERYFPINLKKSETNSNWLKRPLTEMQIDYAADDVEFLLEIYEKQKKILKDQFEKALEDSKIDATLGNQEFYKSRIAKLKNASKLEKKIFFWRENEASEKNIPSSYILKEKKLKDLYKVCKSDKNLKKISGILSNEVLAKSLLDFLEK